jgi:hypothetical protein
MSYWRYEPDERIRRRIRKTASDTRVATTMPEMRRASDEFGSMPGAGGTLLVGVGVGLTSVDPSQRLVDLLEPSLVDERR